MRVLLDTHALLWWAADDPRLRPRARASIASEENECLVSLATCWELAIKARLGKLTLPAPAGRFVRDQVATNGFILLPIDLAHVEQVEGLPFHHRDPFDRLLAAQALVEDLVLVSADPVFRRYGVRRIW